jgi:hypothetical protein
VELDVVHHGDGAGNPREWYFVKRALDRRPVVLMAAHGAGADLVLDTRAADALGYRPVGDHATTVAPTVRALVAAPPQALDERRSAGWFDYAAEDAWLTGPHPTRGPFVA